MLLLLLVLPVATCRHLVPSVKRPSVRVGVTGSFSRPLVFRHKPRLERLQTLFTLVHPFCPTTTKYMTR
jgi:hypothetical protein